MAVEVNRPRHELLAGAALSGDHYRRGAVRDLSDRVEDLDHPGALADDVLEAMLGLQLLAKVLILGAEVLALEGVLDDQVDFVELERLGDVVVGAELHRLHRGLGRGHRGHHDHRGVGRLFLSRAQDLEPVDLRHAKVGDDRVERIAADRLDRGRSPLGEGDVVAGLLERDGQQVAHALLVVHHQDPCFAHVFLVSRGRFSAFAVGRPARRVRVLICSKV